MKHYDLALVGFGNVGQALARLLMRKESTLREKYGITFRVTGIATGRHGIAINPDGMDLKDALARMETGESLNALSTLPVRDNLDFITKVPADVLFENTPVNHLTGQPALDHLRAALKRGMHAITANKGPVVHGYDELSELAAKNGRRFMFESTVMDGAPIFSLYRETLPATELLGFKGILNSCTNYILGLMDAGNSFDEAVIQAKAIGIAETDPSGDIDGWDAAIKVSALCTVVMGVSLKPQDVDRTGIRSITADDLAEARRLGKRWKLVCSAERTPEGLHARVAPEMVSPDSPLYSINGTSSYVQFATDVLPGLGVVESDPGPETTAFGLLADFITAAR